MTTTPSKPKVAVIREEYVRLTGHYIAAMALSQLLYWVERREDFEAFMQEEIANPLAADTAPRQGWVYKTAEALAEELMIGCGASTMRKYLSILVHGGWIIERHNPDMAYDRTLQYRPNTRKIQADLEALGYVLDGYPRYDSLETEPPSRVEDAGSDSEVPFLENEFPFSKNENGNHKICDAIPETPTENTSETPTETTTTSCRIVTHDTPSGGVVVVEERGGWGLDPPHSESDDGDPLDEDSWTMLPSERPVSPLPGIEDDRLAYLWHAHQLGQDWCVASLVQLVREFGPDRVVSVARYYCYARAREKVHGPGWLATMLRGGYPLPADPHYRESAYMRGPERWATAWDEVEH